MLEYDNSAFYYFALTLLVIYIIPGTWYAVAEFLGAFLGSGDVGTKARTAQEKEKAARLKKETTGLTRLNTTAYITNLVCVLIAWAIFLYLVNLVSKDGEVSTFDPYTILGIEQAAPLSTIKKAYRKLSLKFHPDKNIGDKFAEEMFMKIAKAYESLTDETARENLEKYGNPDGKQALEVSIGLPKIILENPKVVLVLYLIGMVVVIPAAVGYWYSNSKQYGEKNIKYETYNAYYTILQESFRMKNLPEVIATSAEARAINVPKPTDNEPMGQLYSKLKSENRLIKPNYEQPPILRGNLLLHAYLLRMTNKLNPVLMKDLNEMLSRTPELVDAIIEISHQRKWLETSIAALKFSQCLLQALWTSNNSLEQLPHLTAEDIKAITTSPTKNGKAQARTLGEYLQIPDDDKKGLANMSQDQREEVLKVCSLIPKLKVEYKLFVEEPEEDFLGDEDGKNDPAKGEEQEEEEEDAVVIKGDSIYESDLVTLRVTLTRENITEAKGKAAPVHAPLFPKTIRENWWLILTDKPQRGPDGVAIRKGEASIHAFEKVSDQSRVVTHEIRFMAPPKVGTYELELQVISDSYLGLDSIFSIEFTVLPASELPEYVAHKEDRDLDNEPTLFEQVMAANLDDDSSDEEDNAKEEEEQEEAAAAGKKAGGKTKVIKSSSAGKGSSGVVVEDVESEDEE